MQVMTDLRSTAEANLPSPSGPGSPPGSLQPAEGQSSARWSLRAFQAFHSASASSAAHGLWIAAQVNRTIRVFVQAALKPSLYKDSDSLFVASSPHTKLH